MESSGNHDGSIGKKDIHSETAVYDQRKRGKAEAGARHLLEAAGIDSAPKMGQKVLSDINVREEKVSVDVESKTSEDASQASDFGEPENEKTQTI